jgi:hypothetical protein
MPVSLAQGVPNPPSQPLVGENGLVTPPWYAFFVNLSARTGGSGGGTSAILDFVTDTVGSLLYRASGGWVGLNPSAAGNVLQSNGGLPTWALLTGANFAAAAANQFLASPSGGAGTPSLRAIASVDLDGAAGQFPGTGTNNNANAGNIGEYVFSSVAIGSAIALTTGVIADITSLNLTPGDWDAWASVALSANSTTIKAWINATSATDPTAPNNGAYASMGNQSQTFPVGSARISLAASTNIYLSCDATFTGTLNGYGFLGARRRR